MKRLDLIKMVKGFGCVLVRHGGKHDWYSNPNTGISRPIPRHREIKEYLARGIIRALGNPRIAPDDSDNGSTESAKVDDENP